MPFCPSCGTQVSDSMRFCGNCGAKFNKGFTKGFASEESQLPKQAGSGRVVGLVFGIIGSIVMIGAGIDMLSIMSVAGNTVAEAYYHAMGAGFIGLGIFCIAITSLIYSR